MTTKFLDNKILHVLNFIVVAFPTKHKKKQCFGRISSLPPRPPPPQKAKISFLFSSRRLSDTNRRESQTLSYARAGLCWGRGSTERTKTVKKVP